MNQNKDLGNKNWYAILGLIATIITIVVFVTDKNLPDFFSTPTPGLRTSSQTDSTQIISTPQHPIIIITATALVNLHTLLTGTDDSPYWNSLLSVRQPTLNEIRADILSIWDANNFSVDDMPLPGIRSFNGTAEWNKEYLWPIYWCAKTQDTLSQNVENILTIFSVNDEVVPDKYIFNYYYDTNTGWKCNYHSIMIDGWQRNSRFTLQVERVFNTEINDGRQKYPAGSYIYELVISVK